MPYLIHNQNDQIISHRWAVSTNYSTAVQLQAVTEGLSSVQLFARKNKKKEGTALNVNHQTHKVPGME